MNNQTDTLPAATTLPRAEQIRWLVAGAGALIGLVLLAMLVHYLMRPESPSTAPLPRGILQLTPAQESTLKVEQVGSGNGANTIAATGAISIDENRSTPIFLPYSGQIVQVFVEPGGQVRTGDPLLRVRTSDIVDARNALFIANASLRSAEALSHLTETNAKRQEEIYKTAGGAMKDYQQAQSDLVAAQSAVRSAQSAVGAARDKLAIFGKTNSEIARLEAAKGITDVHAETVLHAPIGGVVASRAVSVGQYVASGGDKPALTIADPSHVWLVAQLAESDAARVNLGDRVAVRTTAYPGRVFAAVIDNVAAALDPVTHRLAVRASIANPDGALKPQMFASFIIRVPTPASQTASVEISAAAVIHDGEAARVWIDHGNGRLEARNVMVGDSHDGRVSVLSGLSPGMRVVTQGAIFVNEAGLGE